eukprot:m.290067 g.290067  ORF g.290067 m.290067 type:complete len:52 (-) comp19974_c2_seq10:2331-2486(-)
MSTDYCQRLTDHNGHCFDPCVMVLVSTNVTQPYTTIATACLNVSNVFSGAL